MNKTAPPAPRRKFFGPVLPLVLLPAVVACLVYLRTRRPRAPGPCDSVPARLASAQALHRHLFSAAPSAKSPLLVPRPALPTRAYFALLEKECLKGASILPLVCASTATVARVTEQASSNVLWRVLLPAGDVVRAESPFFLSANVHLARIQNAWEVEILPTAAWPCTESFVMVNRGGHAAIRSSSELPDLRGELNAHPLELLAP